MVSGSLSSVTLATFSLQAEREISVTAYDTPLYSTLLGTVTTVGEAGPETSVKVAVFVESSSSKSSCRPSTSIVVSVVAARATRGTEKATIATRTMAAKSGTLLNRLCVRFIFVFPVEPRRYGEDNPYPPPSKRA